jgi:transcriptional regulator, MarR family
LVDRLWPRGISKERAALTRWEKEITPSPDLRKWFGHEPERFATFTELYRKELDANPAGEGFLSEIRDFLKEGNVTLVYAAKDPACNHVLVLKDWIEERLKR